MGFSVQQDPSGANGGYHISQVTNFEAVFLPFVTVLLRNQGKRPNHVCVSNLDSDYYDISKSQRNEIFTKMRLQSLVRTPQNSQ